MRLVIDTDVMVAAMRSEKGASRWLLVAALERRFTMVVSSPLFWEYQAVLGRREHLVAAEWSMADLDVLLDAVAAVLSPVRLAFLWRPATRDPDDDMVLETAVNGQASMIVTFNVHDFKVAAARFALTVMRPGDAMRFLMGESDAEK